jgi:hypothetical protein
MSKVNDAMEKLRSGKPSGRNVLENDLRAAQHSLQKQ